MRLRDLRRGTLGLFGTTTGSLNAPDLSLGQAVVGDERSRSRDDDEGRSRYRDDDERSRSRDDD